MSSPSRRTALLTLLLAVLATPACGADDSDSDAERAAVVATVQRLYDSVTDRDAKGVCKELNRAARRQVVGLSGAPCERVFTRLWASFGSAAAARRPRILRVELDGDRATAIITFGDAGRARLSLARSGDNWKLDRADTSPLM